MNFMHKEFGMRTILDLPDELIQEAMRLTQAKTKTSVIIYVLEDLVRKVQIGEIKEFKGKVDLGIDMDVLRKRR